MNLWKKKKGKQRNELQVDIYKRARKALILLSNAQEGIHWEYHTYRISPFQGK